MQRFKDFITTSINRSNWSWSEFTIFTVLALVAIAILGRLVVSKFI